ncbi:hypothetical protein PC9H_005488 [Pleurotus ostreatus]|uniref:DUF6533 domain-containing protein n=1 Tax=Pleurotus ostreatus TaxID=5322 RepID=A0A8H7A3Z4_PLEOS|nr:uncharacterized protein PC9H_005488 [Pleurotus ostreatus]KAF7433532.1 hypothetical protein PC9H_005488 [Pleurotus ostreatus]
MDFPPELIASLSWNQQSTYLPSKPELRLFMQSNIAHKFCFFQVAGTGLFIYDYVLTLGDEARYVWTAPWSLGKILFLLTRYPTFVDVALALYREHPDSLAARPNDFIFALSRRKFGIQPDVKHMQPIV